MTETEWLTCNDPHKTLEFLRGKVSERKAVLFLCACAWRLKSLLADDRCQQAIETVEKYVDARADRKVLMKTLQMTEAILETFVGVDDMDPHLTATVVINDTVFAAVEGAGIDFVAALADSATESVATFLTDRNPAVTHQDWLASKHGEAAAQIQLLHDIFGNPFRSIAAALFWLTPNVVNLAQAIYQNRAFDRLPVLADALEEAGCTNADILAHCRQPGPHVRGCWVVDLVLGKE